MQTSRGSTLKGVITISLMVVNVVFWVPILLVVALAKLLIPHRRVAPVDERPHDLDRPGVDQAAMARSSA